MTQSRWLALVVLGAAAALVPAVLFVVEHGWDLAAFTDALRSNGLAAILAADLLLCTVGFLVWSFGDARERNVRGWPWVFLATGCIALSCGAPLYFYLRSRSTGVPPSPSSLPSGSR